ncbi:MAG: calcium/sodium antiporter [Candidatus Woesearchaeota archaeon]
MELLWILVFVASLAALVKSSDYFTESAERLGIHFGIPSFIVGVTIVAVGTSLPELISSLFAVYKGSSEIVFGNAVGSNIANIFLVLGAAAVIGKNFKIKHRILDVDLPLLVGSAFLLTIFAWDGQFTAMEGILSLIALVIYLAYTFQTEGIEAEKKDGQPLKETIILIVSGVFIFLGAHFTIESVIQISRIFQIGTELIAVSAIALGTSLPELMVTFQAARKGNPEIAVGNVLGSNIFNTLAVMGIPALFSTLIITEEMLYFSLPVMLMATVLYFFMTQDRKMTRWEGYLLLLFYVVFLIKIIS